jgi:hypothetical protein
MSNLNCEDFYSKNGKIIFTEKYHLKRGYCCGNRCKHCPYFPKYQYNNRKIKSEK